jgi:hypothetical protein
MVTKKLPERRAFNQAFLPGHTIKPREQTPGRSEKQHAMGMDRTTISNIIHFLANMHSHMREHTLTNKSVYTSIKILTKCSNVFFPNSFESFFLWPKLTKELFLNRFVFISLLDLKKFLRISYTRRWNFLQNTALDKYTHLFFLAQEVLRSEANDLGDAGNPTDNSEIIISHIAFT